MNRKHFSWLFALTVAVALIIGLMPERVGRESAFEVRPLLPELGASVNAVEEIRIVRGGDEAVATLRRSDAGWSVEEAGGYPADWPRLRSLLAALAQAQVIEPKTANPEYYDRLGLRDVADEESDALLVRIGADAPALLVGNAARNRDGQYVRLEGEERAFLVDRQLEVPRETRDWLDRQIVDIPEAEVVEVEITHPDGERVLLTKDSADDGDFVLQNLPEGREVQSSWTVNAPGGGLAGLRLDDVRPVEEIAVEQSVRLRVRAADGLQIDAELAEAEDLHWIRLRAAAPGGEAPGAGQANAGALHAEPEAEVETEPEPGAATAIEEEPEAAQPAPGPAERAADINHRVEGWVYAIPQYKYDVLTRGLEDLLKQAESDD